jgi:hypothetical protein
VSEEAISGITEEAVGSGVVRITDVTFAQSAVTINAALAADAAITAVTTFSRCGIIVATACSRPVAIIAAARFIAAAIVGSAALQREVAGPLNRGTQWTWTGGSVRNSRNTVFSEGDT